MRGLLLWSLVSGLISHAGAQSAVEFQNALTGSWIGTLEYRDYSEPAASAKRTKLPTWLTVERDAANLKLRYVYDDGPGKTVIENSLIRLDAGASRYSVIGKTGKVEESYSIEGLDGLRQGRGTLILRGKGLENDAAVEVRTTIRLGRNILEMLRETGLPEASLTFRHSYTFTRAIPLVISTAP